MSLLLVYTCCGKGLLEVKCPHLAEDGLPEDEPKTFCMTKEEDKLKPKLTHAYFINFRRSQQYACNLPFCDFVVWTKAEVIVERIKMDSVFYTSKIEDIKHFFLYGMFPEIVRKWYTRKPVANAYGRVALPTSTTQPTSGMQSHMMEEKEDVSKLWCYCNEPRFGKMILCDNERYTIKWFHFNCLWIQCASKGKWYCHSC